MQTYDGNVEIITNIGTTPDERGLTTEQFKAKFDEGLKGFVEWFNTVHKTEFEALPVDNMYKTTGGTANAQTVNLNGTFDLAQDGNILYINPSFTNTSAMTINPDEQGAKAIKKFNTYTDAYVDVEAGDVKKYQQTTLRWDLTNGFFVLAPKSGASVKSAQRGVASFSGTSHEITINTVDVSQSIVQIQIFSNGENNSQFVSISAVLTNSTTVTLARNSTAGGTVKVAWQVIEYNNVKSKQTGTKATNLAADTVAINPVVLNKAIAIITYKSAVNVASASACFNHAYLSDATQITFSTYNTSATTTYEWQVIEFN